MSKEKYKSSQEKKQITLREVLRGDLLMTNWLRRQIPVIILIAIFVIIYIAEGFSQKQYLLEIDKLNKEITSLRYQVLSKQSDITEFTRESKIKTMLQLYGNTELEPSKRPPYIVEVDE